MATPNRAFDFPIHTELLQFGTLSTPWFWFFQEIYLRLNPLGKEYSFDIVNNQSSAADVTALKVDARFVAQATVDFLVQIVTTGTGATELVESGSFDLVYKPTSKQWAISLTNTDNPDDSGVDFTITTDGQVQYTSANSTGTASISKLYWRMRTMSAKNTLYSSIGVNR